MENWKKHLVLTTSSTSLGVNEGHSVFHTEIKPDWPKDSRELQEAWTQYLSAWQQLSGAGTNLAAVLSQSLAVTGRQAVSGDTGTQSEDLESCNEIAGQFQQLTASVKDSIATETDVAGRDLKTTLLQVSLPDQQKTVDEEACGQGKVLLCVLLKVVQLMQKISCSTLQALDPWMDHDKSCDQITAQSGLQDTNTCQGEPPVKPELPANQTCHQHNNPSKVDAPTKDAEPNALRRHFTRATAFLSKLGHKTGSGSQSAFYVDLEEEASSPVTVTTPVSQSVTKSVDTDAENSGISEQDAATDADMNGHIASQEEIDSVIALLSGCPRNQMQAIPEHVPVSMAMNASQQQQPSNKTVGHPSVLQQHRKSDGAIGDSYLLNKNKTNTWPSKPRGRVSLPADTMSMQLQGLFDGLQIESDYAKYIQSVQQMQLHSNNGSHSNQPTLFPGQSVWSAGNNQGGSTGWPAASESCQETLTKWSSGQDSSSCSDDSSNGETPWSLGLDLTGAYSSKRRHSSSEDTLVGSGGFSALEEKEVCPVDKETKTRTWPMKPASRLSSQENDLLKAPDMLGGGGHLHPPLQMQWSDPLATRNLSLWSAQGVSQSLSFQGLPTGGSTELSMNPLP